MCPSGNECSLPGLEPYQPVFLIAAAIAGLRAIVLGFPLVAPYSY